MAAGPLKTRFIVNPRSGRAAQALPAVQEFAMRHRASVVRTERRHHASELAQQALAEGCDLIVAVGGDGTLNEVARALTGTGVTLGLVPCGSGNGLGRHLGIHGSVSRALDILTTGKPRLIDSGFAAGHPYFTAAGMGFEAEIAHRFNQLKRRGFIRYLTTSMAAFRGSQPEDFLIVHADRREKIRAFTLVVANANQYGNNAFIAPAARVDDGLLNLCAIPPITCWNAVPLVVRLFRGTVGRVPGVSMQCSDRFVVERAAPGLLHTDGEVHEVGTRVEFVVHPGSLRVMAPA